ncbi:MAG: hypothetical protein V7699_01555 [Porticoccus sp.]
MNKKWLLLLVLILNHTLINSVMGASHSSGEEHGIYEPPHIHLSFSDDGHSFTDDSPSNPHDHDKIAHIHAACDLCAVPLLLVSQAISLQTERPVIYQLVYLGLTYKPAVPPPTV